MAKVDLCCDDVRRAIMEHDRVPVCGMVAAQPHASLVSAAVDLVDTRSALAAVAGLDTRKRSQHGLTSACLTSVSSPLPVSVNVTGELRSLGLVSDVGMAVPV